MQKYKTTPSKGRRRKTYISRRDVPLSVPANSGSSRAQIISMFYRLFQCFFPRLPKIPGELAMWLFSRKSTQCSSTATVMCSSRHPSSKSVMSPGTALEQTIDHASWQSLPIGAFFLGTLSTMTFRPSVFLSFHWPALTGVRSSIYLILSAAIWRLRDFGLTSFPSERPFLRYAGFLGTSDIRISIWHSFATLNTTTQFVAVRQQSVSSPVVF